MANETNNSSDKELVGLLAQFDDPTSLLAACNNAREAGYTKMDAYTPFPVHGIDPALGIKRSFLPFIVLAVALGAVVLGLGMQFYTNGGGIGDWSTDEAAIFPGYRFMISGKPYFSLPANIPVTFEVIVLSSAFATFFGMWIINRLPRLSNPLHRVSRFKRVTNDKFFLMLEAKDDKFDASDSEAHLNQWGAVAIEEVNQDLTDTKLPSWMAPAALIGALLLLIPPVAIFSVYGSTNRKPRLHVVPDMDWQHKFKTQVLSPNIAEKDDPVYLFENRRAMRQPVEGSVRFGSLEDDSEMFRGIKKEFSGQAATVGLKSNVLASTAVQEEENPDQWITGFPEGFKVNEDTLARGKQRFEIYCSVCHGYAGNGDGLVNQRAIALAANGKASWTAAKSLHDPTVTDSVKNPTGRIYDTITNGRNTMGPYRDQIPVEDRWAIVAYVKALQATGITAPGAEATESEAEEAGEPEADESAEPAAETTEPEAEASEADDADTE
ncbi:quinol:electron acceptor oxidoreductase subunit ActD [Mariniblastus fucicola]|uniref:Cytochrome c n=1 Tax=Mariniblastus fucicola TaxID=980251 RepID=A0A5B9P1Y6_9BACT|nr:quinol:electron acceptor oxidoreductase subunit ActD [Mariniblastus fucicola]QEG20274.1 Cytochrome c [Mariniblastus fucicola]